MINRYGVRQYGVKTAAQVAASFKTILDNFDWNDGSEVVTEGSGSSATVTGKYYFTEKSYLEVQAYVSNNNSFFVLKFRIVTPAKAIDWREVQNNGNTNYCYTFAMDTTSKGAAIELFSLGDAYDTSDPTAYPKYPVSRSYNIFVGTYKNGDTKGRALVYTNVEVTGSTAAALTIPYTVWTDDNGGETSKQVVTVDTTRKAVFIPVITASGKIFDQLYTTKNTTVRHKKIDVGGKLYVVGSGMCLAD